MDSSAASALLELSPQASFEEVKRFLEAQSARDDARRREQLTSTETLMLAVVPNWTATLADALRATSKIAQAPTAERLSALVREGWLKRFQSPLPEERTPELVRFAMPNSLRHEVLGAIAADPEHCRSAWLTVSQLGAAVVQASANLKIPDDTALWAELARHATDSWHLVVEFDAHVRGHREASGIHREMEAVTRLLPLFRSTADSTLEMALERAGRRLEVLRRKEDDRTHLVSFLEREEQMAAIDELVSSDDNRWALHLVGPGGVGKTMLLRHLTTNFSEDRFAVSRIDFDYLNPDYPRLAPGLLLWSFGQDLRVYAPDTALIGVLDEADQILDKLHQALKANTTGDDKSPLDHPRFRTALRGYVDFISHLGLRVLLVLDTCEELARVRPDGTVPDNVRDTFRILEMLHDGARGLRVLFSGRRLLAREGDGWRAPSAADMPERSYLSLHEVRGFTEREAIQYLERAEVPADLHAAIIGRCPEAGRVVEVEWDTPAAATGEVRLNPYDLKLYAEWAAEKPHPSAATIASSTDSNYVEYRIVRRLSSPLLVQLLPVIAVLGHVDNRMLAELAGMASAEPAFESLERGLRQQEWISTRGVIGAAGEETRRVHSVDPALRPRLLEHGRPGRAEWMALLDRALAAMTRSTIDSDLGDLDWTDFDATLAAFDEAGRPEQAAQWWEKVEQRLAQRNDPAWTRDLLGFLAVTSTVANPAGDAHGEGPPATAQDAARHATRSARTAVRPAVLATYATALRRSGASAETVKDHWRSVASTVRDFPTPAGRARLRSIAAAGLLMASTSPSAVDFQCLVDALHDIDDVDFDPQTASAAIAAAEWSLDWLEALEPDVSTGALEARTHTIDFVLRVSGRIEALAGAQWRDLARHPSADPQALVAWASCLGARAWMWSPESAQHLEFARTLELARCLDDDLHVWSHWQPPESLRARIALEYARHVVDCGVAPSTVLEAIESIVPGLLSDLEMPHGLDHQLLRGIALRLALADAPATPAIVELLHDALMCRPGLGTCVSQRAVTPLCCVAAESLAAHGLVDIAVQRLRDLLRDSFLFDEETRREFERTYLRIVARFRLFEVGEGRVESVHSSTEVRDIALVRTVDALAGVDLELRPDKSGPELEHAYWQTCRVDEPAARREALETWREYLAAQSYEPAIVDALECKKLLGQSVRTQDIEAAFEATQALTNRVEAFRAALRISVLAWLPIPPAMERLLASFALSIGQRRAAEIALDEADLLGLRMPAPAAHLAMLAYRWFDSLHDDVGLLRAGILVVLSTGPGAPPPAPLSNLLYIRTSIEARFAQRCWKPLAARTELVLQTLEWTAALEADDETSHRVSAPVQRLQAAPQADPSPLRSQGNVAAPPDLAPTASPLARVGAADSPEPILAAEWARASSDLRRWRETQGPAPTAARPSVRPAFLAAAGAALLGLAVWGALQVRSSAPSPAGQPGGRASSAGAPLAAPDALETGWAVFWALAAFGLLCAWAWRQWALPRSVRHAAKGVCSLGLVLLAAGVASRTYGDHGWGTLLLAAACLFAVGMPLRNALIRYGSVLEAPGINRWLPWLYFAIPGVGLVAVSVMRSDLASGLLLGFLIWRFAVFRTTAYCVDKPHLWRELQFDVPGTAPHALEPGTTLAVMAHGGTGLFPKTRRERRDYGALRYETTTPWTWQDSYERFAHAFEPDALPLLRRLPRVLNLYWLDIDIDVLPLSLHAWPWEAFPVLGAGGRPANPRQVPIRCLRRIRRRRSGSSHTSRPEIWAGPDKVVVLGAARNRMTWIIDHWASRFPDVHASSYATEDRAFGAASGGLGDDITIAHLVGIPHEDSGGLRFRLGRDGAGHPDSGGEMIRMEDLAAHMPRLRLCILQVLPVAEFTDRRANDRRRAGLLRILAAHLVEACGASVIVIPALPGELASEVLQRIVIDLPLDTRHDARAMRRLLEILRYQVAAAIGKSASVREADMADPLAIAQRLVQPKMSALRRLLSPTAQASLVSVDQLPRETLAGMLAAEFNRLLTLPGLSKTPGLRAAALRALPGYRFGESAYRANRRLLHALFGPALGNGSARLREEAMEVAIEITGFVAGDRAQESAGEPMQSVTA